jgi:hypothetical protein
VEFSSNSRQDGRENLVRVTTGHVGRRGSEERVSGGVPTGSDELQEIGHQYRFRLQSGAVLLGAAGDRAAPQGAAFLEESEGDAVDAADGPEFLLHRRDARNVVSAGGMLQVIPSGMFQPSSVMPGAEQADFDLWRNIMREYSEELLGNPEHDGDGDPVRYDAEPFKSLDAARKSGHVRVYCLGAALDALTLFGEILTVAIFAPDFFDDCAGEFVDINDEGTIDGLSPFTPSAIDQLISKRQIAPAGAGCLRRAWHSRNVLLR